MGRKEKLLKRFLQLPKDFTFEETTTLLSYLGYDVHNKGRTSGSRIRFNIIAVWIIWSIRDIEALLSTVRMMTAWSEK